MPQNTGDVVLRIFLSLLPACLIASANYIVNEILDAPFDRMHPTKRFRPVPSGKVKLPVLWTLMSVLIVVAFVLAALWFNVGYLVALALLLLSGIAYNVEPVRLKDRAYLDVIAESFNNPVRLWLGWYALLPSHYYPPLSIVLAWWFFGALLMAGKRYAEFRFIGDARRRGDYRKSFRVYTERSLILSMVTYANFFCFCMGIAIAVYQAESGLCLPPGRSCHLRLSPPRHERGGCQTRTRAPPEKSIGHCLHSDRCGGLRFAGLDESRPYEEPASVRRNGSARKDKPMIGWVRCMWP